VTLLIIDNYDSFTHNLVHLFCRFGIEVAVYRNDEIDIEGIEALDPDWICLSPGPKRPTASGISPEVVRSFGGRIPILGVCLGMQVINEVLGGTTEYSPQPLHGKYTEISHTGQGIFRGLPTPIRVARYHSLRVELGSSELIPLSYSDEGIIMAIQHRWKPLSGVQFHPESFMSQAGDRLVRNFLKQRGSGLSRRFRKPSFSTNRWRSKPVAVPRDLERMWDKRVELVKREKAFGVEDADFLAEAEQLAENRMSAILLSGGSLDCSRYSIAAGRPFLVLRAKDGKIRIDAGNRSWSWDGDPLATLDRILQGLKPAYSLVAPPFSGGAVGYFAYELKNSIERLPRKAVDHIGLPDLFLLFPSVVLVHDRCRKILQRLRLIWNGETADGVGGDGRSVPWRAGELSSNFSRQAYLQAVSKILHYIEEGDVYQVNLSQCYSFPFFGSAIEFWKDLYTLNPAPFFAYLHGAREDV
jgi:anthranilate synthase/aminodeoxychorismate synthase-like glutamine amidotransferase